MILPSSLLYLYLSYLNNNVSENNINNNIYKNDFYKNCPSDADIKDTTPFFDNGVRPIFNVHFGINEKDENTLKSLLELKSKVLSSKLVYHLNKLELNYASALDSCTASIDSREATREYLDLLYEYELVDYMTSPNNMLAFKDNIIVTPAFNSKPNNSIINNYYDFIYIMSIRYFRSLEKEKNIFKINYVSFIDYVLKYKYNDINISETDLKKVLAYFKALGLASKRRMETSDCIDFMLGLKKTLK